MPKSLWVGRTRLYFQSSGESRKVTMSLSYTSSVGSMSVTLTSAQAKQLGEVLIAYSVLIAPQSEFTEVESEE